MSRHGHNNHGQARTAVENGPSLLSWVTSFNLLWVFSATRIPNPHKVKMFISCLPHCSPQEEDQEEIHL
jgi:hypothetical protein